MSSGPAHPQPIAWCKYPHSAWIEQGYKDLEARGFDSSIYPAKVFKPRALASLRFPFWQAVARCAESHQPTLRERADELIEQALGRRLGVAPSTGYRWAKGEEVPDGNQFVATVSVILKRDILNIDFPNNVEVIWRAVRRSLSRTRCDDCGKKDYVEITREEFACVWWLTRHPSAEAYLRRADSREGVHRAVAGVVNRTYKGVTADRVVRAVVEWRTPYIFFLIGLPIGWEGAFDDAAVPGVRPVPVVR